MTFYLYSRFIGSAKISLLDLAHGHTKSLPAKNLSLVNEKKQDTGVSFSMATHLCH